jgi:hypothetical protein
VTRHLFGGTVGDWTFTAGVGNVAMLASATITFWNAQTGGTQYADLASDVAGSTTFDHVTSSDGTDGQVIGTVEPFYGSDEVWAMWASANSGPRLLMLAADVPQYVASNLSQVAVLLAQLTAHLAAVNPHSTKFEDLADWLSGAVPSDGQVPVYSGTSGKWAPGAGGGGGGGVSLAGGSTIQVPNGDTATRALRVRVPAGDRTAAPTTLSVEWNAGSDSVQNWIAVASLDQYGQLRMRPSAVDRVAARISRISAGQTAHMQDWGDESEVPLSWVEPNGAGRFPNLGHTLMYSLAGTVSTGTGEARLYNDTGVPLTIRAVRASVGTAPTGASLIVDVNKGGSTIFSTQSNRPTITAGNNTSGKVTAINTTTLNDGEYVTVDVDAVGSVVAGADLVVQVLAY